MKVFHIFRVIIILLIFNACDKTEQDNHSSTSLGELSEQGLVMCRKGNYIEGLKLMQEATDMLTTMHPDSINSKEAVKLLGNLANLYSRMGLHEEAKLTNYKATVIADKYALDIRADLWRMRSLVYKHNGQIDSMFICLQRSRELCGLIGNAEYRSAVMQRVNADHAYFFIEHPDYVSDSIPAALSTLEQIVSSKDNRTARFLIGRAYVILGNPSYGLPMMESALEDFRQAGDMESEEWALQLLAQSYAATKNGKLAEIYIDAASLHDTILRRQRDNLLIGMDFRYRTSHLKREKTMLESELRAKRQRIVFISAISVLIILGISAVSITKFRSDKRILRLKQQNIDNLLSERIALNARIEELNNATAENHENKRHEMLSAILLEKDDELRFRKNFNDLYPGFIDKLRREYPNLTSGNELLCMLIALNMKNEEIALALGISRDSLATSRYRLRSRLNLSKDTDLDNFIKSKFTFTFHSIK